MAPSETKLTKGNRTKAAILLAARRAFSEHGFNGASIRSIAIDAQIDPAMVMRYFGSKRNLFVAATEVELELPALAETPRADRAKRLLEHFCLQWESRSGAGDALIMLLRTSASDRAAAIRVNTVFEAQVVKMISSIVEREEAFRRAGLIASQVLGIALTRYILELPAVANLTVDDLIAEYAPVIQRSLEAPLPPRSG
jgi:AcrR family transcriptional regulator